MIRAAMPSRGRQRRDRDTGTPTDRNLALELVRVTEGAAIAAARLMGRNRKEEADQAALDEMRRSLSYVDTDGVVVIGEGEKDEAPMLDMGERAVLRAEGEELGTLLTLDDLCAGGNVFFAAAGITDGELLQGVRFGGRGMVSTHGVVMRSYSGTVRYIEAAHDITRLRRRAPMLPQAPAAEVRC